MKVTILKEKLKNGISIVERVADRVVGLPILNNILINVEKNFLNLTTTDLEIGINWWSLVKTEKEGKIAVPTRVLSGFVNFLPDKPIQLELKGLNLKVDCENHQTSIKGLNPEEFPIIPKITSDENISIKSSIFCQGLGQVVDFVGYASSRPEISGIYFSFQKNLIIITATDSFRLGEKKIFINPPFEGLSKDYSFILPQRAAKEIVNIFSAKDENLTVYLSPNQVMFETFLPETPHPQIQLVSRLIEGEYPNYQEIVPQKYETQITLSRNDFINQVKLASLFGGKINEVKLKIDSLKNKINISSQNPDLGEHRSILNGKAEGKNCEISFNYRFLLDGLLNIKTPEVVLELNGSEKPGILRPKGDESYFYLVMPIKAS